MEKIEAYLQKWGKLSENNEDESWGVYEFRRLDNNRLFKAVGVLQNSLRREGVRMILEGVWEPDKYSKFVGAYQLAIKNHVVMLPWGEDGMRAFLTTAPHIGKKLSEEIWDKWGEKAAEVIVANPQILADEGILNSKRAEEAGEVLAEGIKNAKWYMPIVNLLGTIGFPKKLPQQIISQKWGDPVAKIQADPFVLLDFQGVGFTKTDSLRRQLKLPDDLPQRLDAATAFAISSYSSDTWVGRGTMLQELMKLLSWPQATCEIVLDNAITSGRFIVTYKDEDDKQWIAIRREAEHEANMVREVVKLTTDSTGDWPDMSDLGLTLHQETEITKAFRNGNVVWLYGNAGSGKTFTLGNVGRAFQQRGKRILACAPTGKAALRLQQALIEQGVTNVTPITIHRALKATMDSRRGFYFRVDGHNEILDADLLIVDEVSMLSNELAWRLFKAILPGTKVLCVGDPNQLAPVGRGTLLRDWANWCDYDSANHTYGKLVEIQRHAGQIIKVAQQIARGEIPELDVYGIPGVGNWGPQTNLQMSSCKNDLAIQEHVLSFIDCALAGEVLLTSGASADPVRDIQIIVAVNEDSPASRDEMNRILQPRLNPAMEGKHEIYKVGDKIICTKNTMLRNPETGQHDLFIANGSIGYVRESHAKRIVAVMDDYPDRRVVLPVGYGLGDFNLAYAITCHKFQGSAAPIVATLMGGGSAYRVVDRGWFYTALTRATDLSLLFSNQHNIARACRRSQINERQSFVRTWLGKKLLRQTSPS